ncbi:MAG: type II toxin-antitoxin system Phd/YefM family antitoxin [Eggerthellaceae bacterium]|nr:type II toxin-antitoxin system Phd/YefM family antitoxin [Eggerthellaceae bacterium]
MIQIELDNTVAFSEAKNKFSALTTKANSTGTPFVVTKNRKPWVEVRPLAVKPQREGVITITPLRREVAIPDLDELFDNYQGDFVAREDGFANATGSEAM